VTYAGLLAGREVVVVAHPSGVRSTFEPVAASGPVGSVVARGERVGVVSATAGHCAPQTCVHWGVRRGDTYLDPLAFVGRARVILLPLP
jgi:murein DD-endopeptidase MepM/ murein hydrolase activator NlpD